MSVLTVREAADQLRLSEKTIYRLINSGELGAIRIGGSIRIPEKSLTDLGKQEEKVQVGVVA